MVNLIHVRPATAMSTLLLRSEKEELIAEPVLRLRRFREPLSVVLEVALATFREKGEALRVRLGIGNLQQILDCYWS